MNSPDVSYRGSRPTSRYGTALYGAFVSEPRVSEAGLSEPGAGAETPRCSSKGCRSAATQDLQWRNPKLHDAARVKHWLACDEHAESLDDFLAVRGFLLARTPLRP